MTNTTDPRRAEIAKIKIGQKELRLDEETYRAMLKARTGCRSAADLTGIQRRAILDHMASLGAFKGHAKPARNAVARKVFALWDELAKAGKVRDTSREALRAFVRRQTINKKQPEGIGDPEWLTAKDAIRVIEALKAWLERDGNGKLA